MSLKKTRRSFSVISPLEWVHLIKPEPEEAQIQPNGVDLRISKVYEMVDSTGGELFFSKNNRKGCDLREYPSVYDENLKGFFWRLKANSTYIIEYMEKVVIPADAMGLFFQRSSLWRLYGAVITTSVWDSGYEGYGKGLLKTTFPFSLERGTPIGQLVLFKAKAAKQYHGAYQLEGVES
ncbi:MAG: deoxyuridine 5'-triphosphate nucleotidohydrolase [Candidatus Odinarchaeum yellowstonii]|uniref:Deoxyuridine 5'-triphosphate nucleotidohydrolase n=1 Tax=Odinarchaeota yellowstonii (strain LCB_4) TaxID=1841599 RepID=A0AAF0D2M6_ODILC|nr:MAG: deoxyuridine 5'-triphosphate nucleotidohydrolase [Candidatus Odinarchaeum yellowstonii]